MNAEDKRRDRYYRSKYGIGLSDYNSLLSKQGGRCAICDVAAEKFSRRLSVDHNHQSGEIRGLLCGYCNYRVVGRHKDPVLLRKLADYVEQGTGWFVPKKKRTRKRKRG